MPNKILYLSKLKARDMKHINLTTVFVMWQETYRNKRIKGSHKVNLNVKDGTEIKVGDIVVIKDMTGDYMAWIISEIENVRPSSLTGFKYYTTQSRFTTNPNEPIKPE